MRASANVNIQQWFRGISNRQNQDFIVSQISAYDQVAEEGALKLNL